MTRVAPTRGWHRKGSSLLISAFPACPSVTLLQPLLPVAWLLSLQGVDSYTLSGEGGERQMGNGTAVWGSLPGF